MSVSIPTWYCILFAIHIFEYMEKIMKGNKIIKK